MRPELISTRRVLGKLVVQPPWIHYCTRELVCTNLAAFLKNINIFGQEFGCTSRQIVLLESLSEVKRAGEPRGPTAHNENITLQPFARRHYAVF